jgi:putative glycerol-1-phosphate prenyltransferase
MNEGIYNQVLKAYNSNQKSLSVLIDPEVYNTEARLSQFLKIINSNQVNYIFVGGSLIKEADVNPCIRFLRSRTEIPLVLFPGNGLYLSESADAVLFLSLISGRNPELLIGQHVPVAAALKKSNVEVIPTGYMLIDGGRPTSVSYLSFTNPIPNDKPEIASSTAIAGELLGMKLIYLEAGSGALTPVPGSMIQQVRKAIDIPLIVGGGIDNTEKAINALHAGADMIVVGNKLEQNPGFIKDVSYVLKKFNESLDIH